jgi:hypothetical protein
LRCVQLLHVPRKVGPGEELQATYFGCRRPRHAKLAGNSFAMEPQNIGFLIIQWFGAAKVNDMQVT